MEVTETKADGLSRTFSVCVPIAEIDTKLDERIAKIRPEVQLKGFRPGKVPASHLKKVFGKSIRSELIQDLVNETSSSALSERELRPAGQPEIEMDNAVEDVAAGSADLSYQMHVEIMPDFEPMSIEDISIERPVADIEDKEIDDSLKTLAEQNKVYDPRGKTAKARKADAVVIDFVGKIDGEAFEGGTAEDQTIVLGEGRFIPGFEDQLIGVKAGDAVEVNVTFPEDYSVDTLKGKPTIFEVNVKEIRAPKTPEINEDFAKGLGLESLESLKEAVKQRIETEHAYASRMKAKRVLLDVLDEKHDFELPSKMVEGEFEQIWSQLEREREAGNMDEDDKNKSEDELKAEYRKIAERRVRLGLVLAEIGQRNEVQLKEEEVARALNAEAQKYPGQEREVIELYKKNPAAMAQLRAPLFEEKVVDFIFEMAAVTDKKVSLEALMVEDEA